MPYMYIKSFLKVIIEVYFFINVEVKKKYFEFSSVYPLVGASF